MMRMIYEFEELRQTVSLMAERRARQGHVYGQQEQEEGEGGRQG